MEWGAASMERHARRLVRRARNRTRATVVVAIVVVGLSMSVAGAIGYLYPLQSGDTVAIGCNGSYLSQERLSSTISKLTCTGAPSVPLEENGTPTTPPSSAACNNGQAAP